MKKLLILLLLGFSTISNAEVYRVLVTGWEYRPGYDYMIHLESPLSQHHFVLDCQSFIHELVLYDSTDEYAERIFEIYLNPRSCYQLGSWIISDTDMGGKMCFLLNTKDMTLEIDTVNYQFCF